VTRICYDTSILIDVLRGRPSAVRLVRSHEGDERATTAVSAYELSLGATTAARQRAALELLESLRLLPLDSDAAWRAGEIMRSLRRGGRQAPLRDLLVATIAREAGCRLFTTDRRFPRIEGLDLSVV